MLTPEQIPDAVIEAAMEEYEAAAFARLSEKASFAAMIAAAINMWPELKPGDPPSVEIVPRLATESAQQRLPGHGHDMRH